MNYENGKIIEEVIYKLQKVTGYYSSENVKPLFEEPEIKRFLNDILYELERTLKTNN